MRLFAEYDDRVWEVMNYAKMRPAVVLKSDYEPKTSKVQKNKVKLKGFKNGKGNTGELKSVPELEKLVEVLKKDRDALEIKIDKAYRSIHNYKQALEFASSE